MFLILFVIQPDGFAAPDFFPHVVAVKVKNKNFLISRLLLLYIIIHLTFEIYILYNHYLLLCAKFICCLNKCQIWDLVKPSASVTITVNSGVYSDSVRETFISLILTSQPLKFHRVYLFLCYQKRITTSLGYTLFCFLSFPCVPIYLCAFQETLLKGTYLWALGDIYCSFMPLSPVS